MTDARSPYRIGAFFVGISAVLHLIAPVFGGLSGPALALFAFGVVYLGVGWGLMQSWRSLAYVAFVLMMAGSVAALTGIWALGPVPGWIYASIFVVNWLAVAALFFVLWRPKVRATLPA